jgi:hypothetical protein
MSLNANPLGFGNDELCYSKPVMDSVHMDKFIVAQNENDELRAKITVLEDENRILANEVKELRCDRTTHLEAIQLQADQFQACQLRIMALDQELKLCESQRSMLAAQSSSQAVRILDLEKSITTLTSDLVASEVQQQASSQRLADMAREMTTLQQRFSTQKESNDNLERQLVTIREYSSFPVQKMMPSQPPSPHKRTPDLTAAAEHRNPRAVAEESVPFKERHVRENTYDIATQLESELLQKSKLRDAAQSQLQHLENQKLRTIAEKTRKDAITHEVAVLNSEISDIRKQLRAMNQLLR